MNIYTVIPARGGSKSIPKKNIRVLRGKPLLQYSVEYSLKCSLIRRTVVSTDSEEIAKIAKKCGAEVPFIRPAEFAQDDTPDYPVMRHALEELEKIYQERIDAIAWLRPTSPFRPSGLIERCAELFKRYPEATSIRAVTVSKEHPYRQWKMDGPFMVGYESGVHEPYNLPRQKLPKVYFQCGDIEFIRRETILSGSASGNRVLPIEIDRSEILDIDTSSDWGKAEHK